jgi:hypothetical protein
MAHRGVLFLDELSEFGMRDLETLRQPLKDRVFTISRATGSQTFPANFVLVAPMNTCPCSYTGDDPARAPGTPGPGRAVSSPRPAITWRAPRIHHSDQGVQYAAGAFVAMLTQAGAAVPPTPPAHHARGGS